MTYFAALLNHLFGGVTASIMLKVGLTPDPGHPISTFTAGEILVIIILIVGALILRTRLSVERPGKFQMAMEAVVEFSRGMAEDMLGHEGRQYVALVGTLGLFVILCNLMGVIPGLESPTADGAITLGCATVVFLHYNWQGVRRHGVIGYIKHLCGPMMVIAFLMLPVEIFSNVLRLLSLSVRLWANMMVGGLLVGICLNLVPVVVPAILMGLHAFESLLQAYIFMILPLLYISLAVTEEH